MIRSSLMGLSLAFMPGCSGGGLQNDSDSNLPETATRDGDGSEDPTSSDEGVGTTGGPPGKDGEGPTDIPPGRRISRLTADQFHQSLIVATGQRWPDFTVYAGALGKPDFSEITAEGRALSVSFVKFAHDAARHACREAIDEDQDGAGSSGYGEGGETEPILLRYAGVDDRDPDTLEKNLRYLLLRFLGFRIPDGDPRLDVWMDLLTAPPPAGRTQIDDDVMADRWWAICVGLVTHPDFLTY